MLFFFSRLTTDVADPNIVNDTTRGRVLAIALSKMFKLVSKGNELRIQYGLVIPKLVSMIMYGGKKINQFVLSLMDLQKHYILQTRTFKC